MAKQVVVRAGVCLLSVSFLAVLSLGCDGDTGATGAQGEQGPEGEQGPQGEQGPPGDDGAQGPPGDAGNGVPDSGFVIETDDDIELNVLPARRAEYTLRASHVGRYFEGSVDEDAAEIAAWDAVGAQAFVVNGNLGAIDVIDFSTPETPSLIETLDVSADIVNAGDDGGRVPDGPNSVSIFGEHAAVAVQADPQTDNGWIAFYEVATGIYIDAVDCGALPDLVTFSPDGNWVLAANEGEPDGGVDPEGGVTVIDVSGGVDSIEAGDVTIVGFTDFNVGGAREGELPADVVIAPEDPASSVAQDLEPEFIAISPDSTTGYVTMQENNAVAIVDIASATIDAIVALGFKDYSVPGNEIDASDRDFGVNIRSWPVFGIYQPDSISAYEVRDAVYLVTANEGDARDFSEARAADITDPGELNASYVPADTSFGDAETLLMEENLGRLEIHTQLGVTDPACLTDGDLSDCVYDSLYAYGARSFSIWDGATGELVWDSGNAIEVITASALGGDFNADGDDNSGDSRSDAKAAEPEALTVAQLGGRWFAFVGLERVSGIVIYDITDPTDPQFVNYYVDRDFADGQDGESDIAPESIVFIDAEDSPTGNTALLIGHEYSGTTTMVDLSLEVIPSL